MTQTSTTEVIFYCAPLLMHFQFYAHPHFASITRTMSKISDFMCTSQKKQSESMHKAANALTNQHTKRGPLYNNNNDETGMNNYKSQYSLEPILEKL